MQDQPAAPADGGRTQDHPGPPMPDRRQAGRPCSLRYLPNQERMSTFGTQDPAANGATIPRPGIPARGLGASSLDPEIARSAVVSTVDEVVEHPFTPEEVAMLLHIDRETVYRMARRGELPAFKVSSRWRFLTSRLQRWMEEQEGQAR